MFYSSVQVANTFLFLHLNHLKHVDMNIIRLHMLALLTQAIVLDSSDQKIIDELIIVGPNWPLYEKIERSFYQYNDNSEIETYGFERDYSRQKEFINVIDNKELAYTYIQDIHKQFYEVDTITIANMLTRYGTPYYNAYEDDSLFILPELFKWSYSKSSA